MKSVLFAVLVFFLSTAAFADGGCSSAFQDLQCFKYTLLFLSPMSLASWVVLILVYIGMVRNRTLLGTIAASVLLLLYSYLAELAVVHLLIRIAGDFFGLKSVFLISLAIKILGLVLWTRFKTKSY